MLGFGKKRKKGDKNQEKSGKKVPEDKKNRKERKKEEKKDGKDSSKPKKRFFKKLIFITLLIFIAAGTSGYLVYKLYFTINDSLDGNARYNEIKLEHINLPDEMIQFSFNHFKKLYLSMITFNEEINLLNREIERIESIGRKYPDQIKIAEREKKVWIKSKTTLEKTFIKIEKLVKTIYVLFSVNSQAGLVKIEEKRKELNELAESGLKPAQEMTLKLKPKEEVPKGFIRGNIYRLKKKFL